ncbi:response regulator transcription factor [Natribacillus halophilus]|uniref:DNA-binding response regulator, NarL/FixJ family, contains REC and HTH domains n=1 Tax=Natribacillus halophilus TaxID=549003 RepID=A0A1G8S1Z4_9BACI|nr:response regulator transcription factor [Natribacillus halophilus]SDJ23257.1 DNA-binding response regulator, NarL/FixJ family, contains REC and HTH domains [Natribacillus halophilus]
MKILIVDDDPLVCQSLKLLLEKEADIEVIGLAADGQEAIDQCETALPDVVLMDIRMPNMDGIESTKQLKVKWPELRIMMLTTFKDEQNIRLAIQAGAEGYLLKSTAVENMAQQIRALMAGGSVLDADVLQEIMNPEVHDEVDGLTERENDIAAAIAQGLSNKEIADQLFLSVGTVRNTLSVILDKLELRDRTQLAIYYWKRGNHSVD